LSRAGSRAILKPALGDLFAEADARTRLAVSGEHVAHVEADDLGEAEAGAEGQREDEVVAVVRR
jgi:hypothetical protein